MQYLWEQFNIKTFAAFTAVFVDGKFQPDLSEQSQKSKVKKIKDGHEITITGGDKFPVHIIYIGKIAGKNNLNIIIDGGDKNQAAHLTAKITNEKPAFLNVFIKNTGKNTKFFGKIIAENKSSLNIDVFTGLLAEKAGISVQTKVIAHSKSETKLSGVAEIAKNADGAESDLTFAALCAPDIKGIYFTPAQRISAVPKSASHAASIWKGTSAQIEYLRESGLGGREVDEVLKEAFENE